MIAHALFRGAALVLCLGSVALALVLRRNEAASGRGGVVPLAEPNAIDKMPMRHRDPLVRG